MNLTNEDVQEILQLLDASPFNELHLQTDRFKLSLRRSGDGGWTQSTEILSQPALLPPIVAANEVTSAREASRPGAGTATGLLEVRTPLPGTFYRAPQPGAPPFVEIGSRVDADTVVCIIETMKLMNSIHAGASGKVVEICLANAQFTGKDSVLMRLRPEGE